MKKIPKANMHGDCYEAAGRYITDSLFLSPNRDILLVHGEVTGQGPVEGVKFGHAWIEEGDIVIDLSNGRDIRMPKQLYYTLGNIQKTIKYTPKQVREKILQHKHWGPWEL